MVKHHFLVLVMLMGFSFNSISQCPANIDFERGDFEGWVCYMGTTDVVNGQNVITLRPVAGPVADRHVMLSSSPGDGLDQYGGFPKNCPNGSGHSVRLGNNDGTGEAEGLSYTFTIPDTANKYSLTYSYAVVIQDPGHRVEEQPRMVVEVYNVTDEELITCSSYSFVANNSLPGFQTSPNPGGSCPVLYKDWSSNTINLDGFQGKTIKFFVKTADCIFEAHFGYAYFDVTTDCSSSLQGAVFCKDDDVITVTAPLGYMSYHWFNYNFTQSLGTSGSLQLSPPPRPGTEVALEVTPFPGYGCVDTLFQVLDTVKISADAGEDKIPCNRIPAQIGTTGVSGFVYSWSPVNGLSDPASANTFANPDVLTVYELTVRSNEGGCVSKDSVTVNPQIIDNTLHLSGSPSFCLGNPDAAILNVTQADSVQWFKNDQPLNGVVNVTYHVTGSGEYYAMLYNDLCADPLRTNRIMITVDTAKQGVKYPDIDVPINFPVRLQARDFADRVLWSPVSQLDNPVLTQPYFRGTNTELYTIYLKTQSGCVTADTQLVRTYKKIDIYVPTAFTPNGDGINDYLRPLLFGFEKINHFKVYNRWGKLVFSTDKDLPGWDGRINNRPQEMQTLIWVIEAVDVDGQIHHKTGTTMMLP